MDIFKLFFDHDLPLYALRQEKHGADEGQPASRLNSFMKPEPTYSAFHLSGTRLPEQEFGINRLAKWEDLLQQLELVFEEKYLLLNGRPFTSLAEVLQEAEADKAITISPTKPADSNFPLSQTEVSSADNDSAYELAHVLEKGNWVLYKEQAAHGFDLRLFSAQNIYRQLFLPLQKLTDESFRFFSINRKRMRSERHLYFETWSLDRPPHGAEEVFKETKLP